MANHLAPNNCICLNCNISFKTNSAYLKRGGGKFCTVKCMLEYKKDHRKINVDSGGYLYTSEGRVHRTIMEMHLGRKLTKKEHVHHINGNKQDNRLENLEVLQEAEHHRRHPTKGLNITKACIVCGKEYRTIPCDYNNRSFCSLECYWIKKKGTWGIKFSKVGQKAYNDLEEKAK